MIFVVLGITLLSLGIYALKHDIPRPKEFYLGTAVLILSFIGIYIANYYYPNYLVPLGLSGVIISGTGIYHSIQPKDNQDQ